MTTPALPIELSQAIEREVRRFALQDLRRATSELSERYRAGDSNRGSFIGSDLDVAAYAAYRMPATYAALWNVLGHLVVRLPDWIPQTYLDIGAGTGSGLWAASHFWPEIERAYLLDQDDRMLELGERLSVPAFVLRATSVEWQSTRIGPHSDFPRSNLAVASYALNELPHGQIDDTVERIWAATEDVVVVVEPGTPRGFQRLRQIRRKLISLGGTVVAPCPHDDACPMPDDDWCHFNVRLPRSRNHMDVKPGELGFEDEKFSYVIVSRSPLCHANSRILRHPQLKKGMVRLELCTVDGLQVQTVTRRKHRELYRAARSSSWGDEFPSS